MLSISCGLINNTHDPYYFLKKHSMINFKRDQFEVISFNVQTSGIKDEGLVEALYKIYLDNSDSLNQQLVSADYNAFPLAENINLDINLSKYYKMQDKGYYKVEYSDIGLPKGLVLVNLSQKIIFISKAINE